MSISREDRDGKSKSNKTHLTLDQRIKIKDLLDAQANQSTISEAVGVSKTTISREVFSHRKEVPNTRKDKFRNPCVNEKNCTKQHLCENTYCRSFCKNCPHRKNCNQLCADFQLPTCPRHKRYPYVCNGCPQKRGCMLDYFVYDPDYANTIARRVLIDSRRGINMSEEEFAKIDSILVQGTQRGQSVEHIAACNNLPVSPRTLRNYINNGITTVKKLDTPRGATYKPRCVKIPKDKQTEIRAAKIGRDYTAFLKYAESHPMLFFTELDTVEGKKPDSTKVRLLTFILVRVKLFYAVLIPDGRIASVKKAIDRIYRTLGHEDFSFAFGVLLTDNGIEFADPGAIETTSQGVTRSKMFFCQPYASWEKGAIENCHELLRRILPKGASFKDLTDEMVDSINSNINSYCRESIDSKCAYDLFVDLFGDRAERILKKLKIEKIPPQDVILHPSLLKAFCKNQEAL